MNKMLPALVFMVIWTGRLPAQGTFQNLDFQSAQIIFANPPSNTSIATTNALPYWSAYAGTNSLSSIHYGGGTFAYSVALNSYSYITNGSPSVNYSVSLALDTSSPQPGNTLGSISQTGLVPADAQTLFFKSWTNSGITVSLGGEGLSYMAISNAPDYTIYGATIPSIFAGQVETLTFMTSVNGGGPLDEIQFSSVAIPEPSAISLICLGSGMLFYLRRKRCR